MSAAASALLRRLRCGNGEKEDGAMNSEGERDEVGSKDWMEGEQVSIVLEAVEWASPESAKEDGNG